MWRTTVLLTFLVNCETSLEYEEYWINGIQINKDIFMLNRKLEKSLSTNLQSLKKKKKI